MGESFIVRPKDAVLVCRQDYWLADIWLDELILQDMKPSCLRLGSFFFLSHSRFLPGLLIMAWCLSIVAQLESAHFSCPPPPWSAPLLRSQRSGRFPLLGWQSAVLLKSRISWGSPLKRVSCGPSSYRPQQSPTVVSDICCWCGFLYCSTFNNNQDDGVTPRVPSAVFYPPSPFIYESFQCLVGEFLGGVEEQFLTMSPEMTFAEQSHWE